ncbi:MAG: dimethyl sulfoxide reductase anchor subunit [Coriobacteriales bacterium]|jgi:anaerobic dimethyl sulfoxide reductase subunit C (anchor subunit)|nr:dimethyl sulfoxide reductase anchor subunit [Coriobacteriales bacterium]
MEIQWSLVFFSAIGGVGACLFASAALEFLLGRDTGKQLFESVISLVLLAVGGILSVTHLSHPSRILEALNHPTSGIFIEALLIGLTGLCVLIYLIVSLRDVSPTIRKVFAGAGLVLGLAFAFACGFSYIIPARAAWDTLALPLAYLGTVLGAGAALNLFIKAFAKNESSDTQMATRIALVAGVFSLLTVLIYCLNVSSVLFSVTDAVLPWVIVLFGSLLIATICCIAALRKGKDNHLFASVALLGALVGAVALRSLMWLLGSGLLDFFQVI